jgi:hypothetical protein
VDLLRIPYKNLLGEGCAVVVVCVIVLGMTFIFRCAMNLGAVDYGTAKHV